MNFKDYYYLTESFSDNAYIFDLDDTIISTGAKIEVIRDGKKFELTPAQWNEFKREPGDKINLGQFDDSNIFFKTAKPTKYFKVIENISNAIKRGASNSYIYILTARGGKIRNTIYDYLKQKGIEVRLPEIYTVGDNTTKTIAELKKDVLRKIRNTHIGNVIFFDDDKKNIELAKQIPGIKTRLV